MVSQSGVRRPEEDDRTTLLRSKESHFYEQQVFVQRLNAAIRCWPGEHRTRYAMLTAVALGIVVTVLLGHYITKFNLPDIPEETYSVVSVMSFFNALGVGLAVLVNVGFGLQRQKRVSLVSMVMSITLAIFWLTALYLCILFVKYFSTLLTTWPDVGFVDHRKNGKRIRTFEELKHAQHASIGSAILSTVVVGLWAVAARYRVQEWRAVRLVNAEIMAAHSPNFALQNQQDELIEET